MIRLRVIERCERGTELVLNVVYHAILIHVLVPTVPLVPSILDNVHLALFHERFENRDVVRVADADHPGFALVAERDQHAPRLQGLWEGGERGMEDV